MANSDIIEVKRVIDNLTSTFKAHDEMIAKAAASVNIYTTNVSKLPSEFKAMYSSFEGMNKAMQENNQKLSENAANVKTLSGAYNKMSSEKEKNTKVGREAAIARRLENKEVDNAIMQNSKLASAYERLNAKAAAAGRTLKDMVVVGRQATQSQKEFDAELRKAQGVFDGYNAKLLAADKATGAWGRSNVRTIAGLNQMKSGVMSLMSAFGLASGAFLAVSIVKDIFQTTKELQSMDMALKQVTDTAENFATQQSFLKRISEAYGVEIKSLTQQFTQFYVSAKDKMAGNEIEAIFESFTKAGAKMGLSMDAQQRIFLALNQMMSKGTIQAEELRGQLGEALPGAFGMMAKAMNVTEKELAKMMKAGDLLATEALPRLAKQVEKTYGIENVTRVETIAAAQSRLSNSWTEMVRSMNESETGGISVFFKFLIDRANDTLSVLTDLNKGWKSLRDEAAGGSQQSTSSFFESVKDQKERSELAKITRADALKWIGTYNEQLKKANYEYELFNKVSLLNLSPERVAMRIKAEEDQKRLNEGLGIQRGRLLAANAALKETQPTNKKDIELTEAQIAARKRHNEELAREAEELAKNMAALKISNLVRDKTLIQQKIGEDKSYVKEKLELELQLATKEIEIAMANFAENVRLHKKSLELQKIDANNFTNDIEKITKESEERILKIKSDSFKEYQDYIRKYGRSTGDDEKFGINTTFMPTEDLEKLVNDFDTYKDKLEETKDKTKELDNITKDFIKTFSEGFFSDAGLGSMSIFLDETLDEVDGKMKSTFQKMFDHADGAREKFQVTFLAITEVAQEAFNFISQASAENFQNEYSDLEKQHTAAISFAGNSAEAKKEIDKQYEDRQRAIKNREAKANKEMAMFNIAINTAQAIVGALPNYALAIAVGILGAAQLVMVSGKKVPQYFKGTDNAPGGLAIVDELRPEVHTDSKGNVKSYGSEDGANYRHLESGDKIYKSREDYFNKELKNVLGSNDIAPFSDSLSKNSMSMVVVNNNSMDTAALNAMGSSIVSAINGKTEYHQYLNKSGFQTFVSNGNNRKELLNNEVNFTSNNQ